MKKMLVVLLVAFFAMVGLAAAAEIEGKIQAIDMGNNQVVLEDGTALTYDDSTKITVDGQEANLNDLKEGAKVKASYEEKDGNKLATTLDETGQ